MYKFGASAGYRSGRSKTVAPSSERRNPWALIPACEKTTLNKDINRSMIEPTVDKGKTETRTPHPAPSVTKVPISTPSVTKVPISTPSVIKVPISTLPALMPEIVKKWDKNFHTAVTRPLIKFIEERNANRKSKSYVTIVTGPTGAGKTFAARHAIESAGYEVVSLDNITGGLRKGAPQDVEFKIRQALLSGGNTMSGPAGKCVRVVLIDDIDGMPDDFIKKVSAIISRIIDPQKHLKRKRKNVRCINPFWMNPIILTAETRFSKNIMAICKTLEVNELKCAYPTKVQIRDMVVYGCRSMDITLRDCFQHIIHSSSDVTFVLNQVYFASIQPGQGSTMVKDKTRMDLFKCGKKMFTPGDMPYEDWDKYRTLGGYKMHQTMFSTYPYRVSYIPTFKYVPTGDETSLTRLKTEYAEFSDGFHTLGLDQMAEISDAYSLDDTYGFDALRLGTDFTTEVIGRTFFRVMKNVIGNKSSKIDVTSQIKNPKHGQFPGINMSRSEIDKYQFCVMMNQMEVDRKLNSDSEATLSPEYMLCNNVGWYMSATTSMRELETIIDKVDKVGMTWCDVFRNPDEEGDQNKVARKRIVKTDKVYVRVQAVKSLSHRFKFHNPQPPLLLHNMLTRLRV